MENITFKVKTQGTKFLRNLLGGMVVGALSLATPTGASAGLVNLVVAPVNFVATGNALCPGQPFFVYSGGDPDFFAASADPAYPSPNLLTYMTVPPSVQGVVDYDVLMNNGRLGDS